MIAIGNGEFCPFCKGTDRYVNNPNVSFVEHLFREHPKDAAEALFGDKDVGL